MQLEVRILARARLPGKEGVQIPDSLITVFGLFEKIFISLQNEFND
jgi:hypothetical protein